MADEARTDQKVKNVGDSHSFRNVAITIVRIVFPLAAAFAIGYVWYTFKAVKSGLNTSADEIIGNFGQQGGDGFLEISDSSFSCRVSDFSVSSYPFVYKEGKFEAKSGEKTAVFWALGKNEIFSVTFGQYFVRVRASL